MTQTQQTVSLWSLQHRDCLDWVYYDELKCDSHIWCNEIKEFINQLTWASPFFIVKSIWYVYCHWSQKINQLKNCFSFWCSQTMPMVHCLYLVSMSRAQQKSHACEFFSSLSSCLLYMYKCVRVFCVRTKCTVEWAFVDGFSLQYFVRFNAITILYRLKRVDFQEQNFNTFCGRLLVWFGKRAVLFLVRFMTEHPNKCSFTKFIDSEKQSSIWKCWC